MTATETVQGTPVQTRVRTSDALGRLWKVVENGAEVTSYTYDAADRLTGVNQSEQMRTFTYSTAGRLLTAENPESGLTTYGYTAGGRLLTKTDARGVMTCMGSLVGSTCTGSFDGAGRPLAKSYSDGTAGLNYADRTPAVSYTYEGERLREVANSNAVVSYGFDGLDRVISRTQTVGTPVYTHTGTYEPAGLKTETYHSGRVVTYTRDGVGRVTGVTGQKIGVTTNYVTTVSYAAHGGAAASAYGGGPVESRACESG